MILTNRPFWFSQDAEQSPSPTPVGPTEAVVLGGGVAGLGTALALARGGVEVTLLEAGRIGRGATGRSDGQVILATGEHPSRLVGQLGEEGAGLLFAAMAENARCAEALPAEETRWHGVGGWRLAESANEAVELRESAAWLGPPNRFVDRRGIDSELKRLAGFHGGLYRPAEAVVDPMGLASALAGACREAGVIVHEGIRVDSIEGEAGDFRLSWRSADTTGLFRAQVVVLAASCASRHLDSTGYLARTLHPFRAQALATPPLPWIDELPEAPMSSHFCYEYFRRHGDRLVAGGMRWSVPGEEMGIEDDTAINSRIHANLVAWLGRHLPDLAGVEPTHAWTGILCGTPDGLPLCGMIPGHGGLFTLCGFNGYGLSLALALANDLAHQVTEGRSPTPWAPLFRPARFT